MTKLLSQLQASTGVADNDLLHQGDTSAGDDKKLTMAELRAYLDGYYAELSRPNRNLIANGSFRVNQQGSASKTETNPGWNYDTWYYTGTYLETFVEEADIFDGTFTLSWESDATAEWALADTATGAIVGTWASVSNGGNFTLTGTAGNHLWIRFAAGTAGLNALDLVQLEVGSVATDFDRRSIMVDEVMVKRFYQDAGTVQNAGYTDVTIAPAQTINISPSMHTTPSVESINIVSNVNYTSFTVAALNKHTLRAEGTTDGAGNYNGRADDIFLSARPPIPV